MSTISFYPHNIEKIVKGNKTQTRRLYKFDPSLCPYGKVGDILAIEEDSTTLIRITDVSLSSLEEITNKDAIKEGYKNKEQFLRGKWATEQTKTYGNPIVWVISFERVR